MFFLTGRTCRFLVLSNITTVLVWPDDGTLLPAIEKIVRFVHVKTTLLFSSVIDF
jgi:hypothetical protein